MTELALQRKFSSAIRGLGLQTIAPAQPAWRRASPEPRKPLSQTSGLVRGAGERVALVKKAFVRERVDMASGTVKWFNSAKGYGFIQPEEGGKDVFVHVSAVERAGLRGLNEGQKIEYELQDERGRTAAVNLKAT